MTALTITGVTKAYGVTPVLHGIDLRVAPGGLTAVLGPSGCGKTTLLRLIAGFADPDAGTIAFGDTVVFRPGSSVPPQRRHCGYVPQEGALFPHLTVAANISFGLPGRAHRARVAELLDLVGMPAALASRHPHELSGGQRQRVALARALAPNPAVVLLDEPFSALDAGLREGTRRAVAEALRIARTTAVLVTHDQAEALSLADQVAVLREGLLVQAAAPETVYRTPHDLGVAGFVGEAIILPATVRAGQATCALGAITVDAADGDIRLMIRPEQLVIGDTGVPARVRAVNYFGHDASIRLELLPDGPTVVARVPGTDLPDVNDQVDVLVRGPAVAFAPHPSD